LLDELGWTAGPTSAVDGVLGDRGWTEAAMRERIASRLRATAPSECTCQRDATFGSRPGCPVHHPTSAGAIRLLAVNGKPIDDEAAAAMVRNLSRGIEGWARIALALRLTVAKTIAAVMETAPVGECVEGKWKHVAVSTFENFVKDCKAGEQSASELVADMFVASCEEARTRR
jgi:hypothetical protein